MKAAVLGTNTAQHQHSPPMEHQHSSRVEQQSKERYKGIVFEGLPELITNNYENIRKLDSAVLNKMIVSHIEVVDSVLRITFADEESTLLCE